MKQESNCLYDRLLLILSNHSMESEWARSVSNSTRRTESIVLGLPCVHVSSPFASLKFALPKTVSANAAPLRFAPLRSAALRFARLRLAPLRFAAPRSAPLRFGHLSARIPRMLGSQR